MHDSPGRIDRFKPCFARKPSVDGNEMLSRLSAGDRGLLVDGLRMVPITTGQSLIASGKVAPFVYFPVSGAVAVTSEANNRKVAVSLIGREGIVHPALALGLSSIAYAAHVEFDGHAYRIAREHFLRAVEASSTLHRLCMLYREAEALQSHSSALAHAHRTEHMLARWLLMCHDRIDGDELNLIHDRMASLMAIRRPTITNALHVLEGHRLIAAKRGVVRIVDRAGLEHHADGLYGGAERERHRLLEAF